MRIKQPRIAICMVLSAAVVVAAADPSFAATRRTLKRGTQKTVLAHDGRELSPYARPIKPSETSDAAVPAKPAVTSPRPPQPIETGYRLGRTFYDPVTGEPIGTTNGPMEASSGFLRLPPEMEEVAPKGSGPLLRPYIPHATGITTADDPTTPVQTTRTTRPPLVKYGVDHRISKMTTSVPTTNLTQLNTDQLDVIARRNHLNSLPADGRQTVGSMSQTTFTETVRPPDDPR